jgi:hypothetical protein
MCNFTSDFISESNFDALRLLEHRDFLFPSIPTKNEPSPAEDEAWHTIRDMKNQMQAIELTETPTGKHHFDVPKGGGHGKQKKDLYTAFMLAARCIYDILWTEGLPDDIMHHGGVVRGRQRDTEGKAIEDAFGGNVPQALMDKMEIARDPEAFKRRMINDMGTKRKILTSSTAVLRSKPKKKGR